MKYLMKYFRKGLKLQTEQTQTLWVNKKLQTRDINRFVVVTSLNLCVLNANGNKTQSQNLKRALNVPVYSAVFSLRLPCWISRPVAFSSHPTLTAAPSPNSRKLKMSYKN